MTATPKPNSSYLIRKSNLVNFRSELPMKVTSTVDGRLDLEFDSLFGTLSNVNHEISRVCFIISFTLNSVGLTFGKGVSSVSR